MHTSTPEKLDDGTVVIEATTVEAAMAEAVGLLGPDADVVAVERVPKGGIGGFFAREVMRVTFGVAEDAAPAPARPAAPEAAAAPEAPAVDDGVVEARPSGVDTALARLAAMEDRREATFGDVLRDQLGPAVRSTAGRSLAAAREDRPTQPAEPTAAPRPSAGTVGARPVVDADGRELPASLVARMRAWHGDDQVEALTPSPVAPVDASPEPTSEHADSGADLGADLGEDAVIDTAALLAAVEPDPDLQPTRPARDRDAMDLALDALLASELPSASPAATAAQVYEVVAPDWLPAVTTSDDPGHAPVRPTSAPPAAARPAAPATGTAAEVADLLVLSESVEALESVEPLDPPAPLAQPEPAAAVPRAFPAASGAAWSVQALAELGLPTPVLDACQDLDGADELTWLATIGAAVAAWCGPEPLGERAIVGPRSHWLAEVRDVPVVALGEDVPETGDVALRAWGHREGAAWVRDAIGDRWTEVVISPDGWDTLVDATTRVVSYAGSRHLLTALALCAREDLTLGYATDGVPGAPAVRVGPLDVALTIRSLLPRS